MSNRPYGLRILVTFMETISSIVLITIFIRILFFNNQHHLFISIVCLIVGIELIYFAYLNWIYFFDRHNVIEIVKKLFKKEDEYEQGRN